MSYLVKCPFGVSQESNAVVVPHTDSHSREVGRKGLPHSLGYYRHSARHWTRGVIGSAGICLKGILQHRRDYGLCQADLSFAREKHSTIEEFNSCLTVTKHRNVREILFWMSANLIFGHFMTSCWFSNDLMFFNRCDGCTASIKASHPI